MIVLPPFDPPINAPNYWAITTISFNRSTAYPQNSEYWSVFPNDIQVYDINGDGHLDVLQVYSYIPDQYRPGIPIRVLLGDGHGGFTDGTSKLFPNGAPLGNAATGVSIADFNGDGVKDIFIPITWETPNIKDANNILILSDGHGGVFDASSRLPTINDYSHWSSAGDIDGDGDIDIYVCNLGSDPNSPQGDVTSYFLINSGDGHFARSDTRLPSTIENGSRSYISSLLFDADGDGDKDLLLGMWGPQAALLNNGATSSLILFNDGTGKFLETAKSALPPPLYALDKAEMTDMDAIDLNGDGALDLLLLTDKQFAERGIQVLINNGDGTFRDETSARLSAFEQDQRVIGRYLHLTDINGDGVKDLVLQTGGTNRFYLNDGSGHFVALPADFLFTNTPDGVYAFVPGDFDEDGRTDIFVRTIVNAWDDPQNVTEFDWIALWRQPSGSVLVGNSSANAVLGSSLTETLTGLSGNDVLFGGGGSDLFRDTASNLSGDTIVDFKTDDRIVITDATVGSFTYSFSGNTLTYSGGSLTLTTAPTGQLVATAAMGGGVQLTIGPPPQRAHNDFNGDGRSDILWRTSTGTIFNFLGSANGGVINNGGNSSVAVDPAYSVAGLGDFNGDGRTDILWRNPTNGVVFNFLGTASGGYSSNGDNSFVAAGTNVRVVGIGDFNGDGRADILWRNDAGTIFNFLGTASGGFTSNGANSAVNVDNDYQVAGTGDFNGDGRTDILWRNSSTGVIFNFLGTASGGFANNGDNSYVAVGTSTQVAGIGDFDGDGRSDILWRNGAGTIFNFLGTASGGYANNGGNSSVTVDNAWHIASTADFNGDNRADILWRNDVGVIFDFLGTASGGFSNNGDNSYVALAATTLVQDPFM